MTAPSQLAPATAATPPAPAVMAIPVARGPTAPAADAPAAIGVALPAAAPLAAQRPAAERLAGWTLLAVLAAAAAAVQVVESPLPRLLPWLKPGLANALTLFALVRRGPAFALAVAFLRTGVAGVALGTLLSPPFFLSCGGAVAAAAVMALAAALPGRPLGLVGVSVLGALANNATQLLLVERLFAARLPLVFNLSLAIWVAIPAGWLVARICEILLVRTSHDGQSQDPARTLP